MTIAQYLGWATTFLTDTGLMPFIFATLIISLAFALLNRLVNRD